MKYVIDRFEGEFAVVELENKKFANIPHEAIPPEAKEGDIILVTIDNQHTKEQKEKIKKMMENLWVDGE